MCHVPFAAAVSSCSWSFLSSSLSSSVLTSNEVPSGLLWRRQPAAKWCRLFTCAGLALHAGKQPGIHYNTDGLSTADAVLSGFNSLGIIVRDRTGCLAQRDPWSRAGMTPRDHKHGAAEPACHA